ncbi:hypothetical protein ACFQY9_08810 [Microvirga aerilata]|nr:hypothetical protein [Microvirga aerilata]
MAAAAMLRFCSFGQMEAAMHMDRFVVFQFQNEWLVTYGDRTQISFASREEAEKSAFNAADALASNGRAVSVLIMPEGPAERSDHFAVLDGHVPRTQRN